MTCYNIFRTKEREVHKMAKLRYKVILTYGKKVVVKNVYGLEQARDYAVTADKGTIIDTWKNKIVK